MRVALIGVLLVAAHSLVANSQSAAVANGNCNIVISGNNNTVSPAHLQSDQCGVGKEQLEQIITLLNAVFTTKDAASINAKLNELIALAKKPTETQNCVGSYCVQNGNQTNYDNRQFGVPQPPPSVTITTVDAPLAVVGPSPEGELGRHPGVQITVTLNGPFSDPQFLVFCDRPCQGTIASIIGVSSPMFYRTNDPSVTFISVGAGRPLRTNEKVTIIVRSVDNDPIRVNRVEPYAEPLQPR